MSLKFLQLATCTNCKCNNMLYTWVKVVYINCTAIFLQVKLAGLQHRHLVTICFNPATEVCMQSTHALKQTWKSSQNSLHFLFVSISHLFHSAENFSSFSIYWCLHGTFFQSMSLHFLPEHIFYNIFSPLRSFYQLCSAIFTEANNMSLHE